MGRGLRVRSPTVREGLLAIQALAYARASDTGARAPINWKVDPRNSIARRRSEDDVDWKPLARPALHALRRDENE